MPRIGQAASTRALCALLLALLIGLRLLSPAGFMPAFDKGVVTIVSCPDYQPLASHSHHGKRDDPSAHQTCPYASVSGLSAVALDGPTLFLALLFAVPLLLGRTSAFVQRQRRRERPPLRGPPIPA